MIASRIDACVIQPMLLLRFGVPVPKIKEK